MWDWELLKNGSGCHKLDILAKYHDENFQYSHVISYGSQEDEFVMHNHAMYEIIYSISGNVSYVVEGEWYPLEDNSLLVISPTVPHKLVIGSDLPFERHILYINHTGNNSIMNRMLSQCFGKAGRNRIGSVFFSADRTASIKSYFDSMSLSSIQCERDTVLLTPMFAQALIAGIVLSLKTSNPEKYSVGISKTVDKLLLYLNKNYTEKLSLTEIAERFHVSQDYCNRIFRKATGMTVMQYIIYCRVISARNLLNLGASAAEAGQQVGFADYSSFFRAYKKVTGRSPKEDHEIAGEYSYSPKFKIDTYHT